MTGEPMTLLRAMTVAIVPSAFTLAELEIAAAVLRAQPESDAHFALYTVERARGHRLADGWPAFPPEAKS